MDTAQGVLIALRRYAVNQAFVEIVARHQAMVCGIALSIVGSIAASEDVAQEAFLTAWRKIRELREPAKLRAWLRQIAISKCLMFLRSPWHRGGSGRGCRPAPR